MISPMISFTNDVGFETVIIGYCSPICRMISQVFSRYVIIMMISYHGITASKL